MALTTNGIDGGNATGGVKLSELRDYDAIAAELELVQYDLTRQLTRFIAARASQLQARAELLVPMSVLQLELGSYNYSTQGDSDFPAELLESLDQLQSLDALDQWLTQARHFPGDSLEQQARWQSLLQQAGFSVPQKVPVYMQSQVAERNSRGEVDLLETTAELVWMDPAQREVLATTMGSAPALDGAGVTALISLTSSDLANGNTRLSSTTAWCLDRGMGPSLSLAEFNQLRTDLSDTLAAVSQALSTENARLRLHNARMLGLLENGVEIVKEMRRARDSQQMIAQEQDQTLQERGQLRKQARDWQNAQPAQHGEGRAAVPGSTRAASFPTSAPTPADFALPPLKQPKV